MLQREFPGVRDPAFEVPEQRIDEGLFASESGQQRQVDIDGQARFAPALQRDSANEAVAPVLALADPLEGLRGPQNLKNGGAPS